MKKKQPYFPNLESEIAKNGLLKKDIAAHIGISQKSLQEKLSGKKDFWMREVSAICALFPETTAEQLFKHN